ncbi:MAG: hypothetical protein GXX84_09795 [Acidobacteria bacterium]|nr:hypothetical protein [Acidobacteriota bacterium]
MKNGNSAQHPTTWLYWCWGGTTSGLLTNWWLWYLQMVHELARTGMTMGVAYSAASVKLARSLYGDTLDRTDNAERPDSV